LKALSILSEEFGDIYVNFGPSISAKDYFRDSHKWNAHTIKPMHLINLTPEENGLIQNLSHEIVSRQQSHFIITTFQIMATAIAKSVHRASLMNIDELCKEVVWLSDVIKSYGGNTFDYDESNTRNEVKKVLSSHRNLVHVNDESQVKLVNTSPFIMTDEIKMKMKGIIVKVDVSVVLIMIL
jgi:glycerol-3-phosphate O-acyltransferase